MIDILVQIVGWAGAFLLIFAYILVSRKNVDGGSKVYQLINLLGAIGVGVNVLYHRAWPALAVQIIWGSIALITLSKK